jgi:hypothetical protein
MGVHQRKTVFNVSFLFVPFNSAQHSAVKSLSWSRAAFTTARMFFITATVIPSRRPRRFFICALAT